jgi:steroid delta-isomerase-like uncharacterized protein
MTHAMKELVERTIALWNEGDYRLAPETYTEDVVYHHHAFHEPLHGREAALDLIRKVRAAFPDFKTAPEETVGEESKIFIRWAWTGTHRGEWHGIAPTGRAVRQIGVTVLHLKDNRIAEVYDIADSQELRQQLETVPEVEDY